MFVFLVLFLLTVLVLCLTELANLHVLKKKFQSQKVTAIIMSQTIIFHSLNLPVSVNVALSLFSVLFLIFT